MIFVIFTWKRPASKKQIAGGDAERSQLRRRFATCVTHLAFARLLLRSGTVIFFASSFWALLPAVAKELSKSALGYGLLLGFFGVGAVLGAVVLQRVRSKLSTETVHFDRDGDIRRAFS